MGKCKWWVVVMWCWRERQKEKEAHQRERLQHLAEGEQRLVALGTAGAELWGRRLARLLVNEEEQELLRRLVHLVHAHA